MCNYIQNLLEKYSILRLKLIPKPRMDGDEERKSKQHRASRAGRGHDKKANKSEHSFHSEIDEKRQEKERAGSQKRNPKVLNKNF